MNKLFVATLCLALYACAPPKQQTKKDQTNNHQERKWTQLFNGKNLEGWSVKIRGYELNQDPDSIFRVKDGKIVVSYPPDSSFNNEFGHMFYDKPFSSYIIGVEYRFTGQQCKGGPSWAYRNSGIMIHCQPPKTMLKDQDFPISIETQLLSGDETGERPTCNLCTPGTEVFIDGVMAKGHCFNSTSKTFRGEEWVRAEVMVLRDSIIKHIVNGDTVMTYTRPSIGGDHVNDYDPAVKKDGQPLTSGYISLQSESHPVEFRKVEIMELE